MHHPLRMLAFLALLCGLSTGAAAQAPAAPADQPAALPANPPSLELPIRCTIGDDCAVQFYPDADTSADIHDYRCGRTTYNTHRGTDIRVPTMDDVRRGVEVLAAAPGMVAAIRDGEPDIDVGQRGREELVRLGRAGGNLVVLRHPDGWTTLYWHMRKGSVRVHEGEEVKAGQVLGLVGLSGDTNFPHLHFEVRHKNRHVDPFTGRHPQDTGRCGVDGRPLWSARAAETLKWRDVTLVQAGFADRAITRQVAYDGVLALVRPSTEASALAFWWELSGVDAGDRTIVRIVDPQGRIFVERTRTYDRARGFVFDILGRKRREQPWRAGIYQATLRHERGNRTLLDVTREITVR
jgi:murein DD-endopeptidase MepM/ murein hydrolase activator NlpD